MNYKFNLEKSPYDPKDLMFETISKDTIDLPEVFDLRKKMKSPRDQGEQGSCSAQTAAAIKEWHEYVDRGVKEYMSPQFIYNSRQNQNTEGMMPRDTMKILQKIGVVLEKEYPYFSKSEITEELKLKAAKNRIKNYAQINSVDSLKKALYINGPCYIAFPVFNPNSMEIWKQESPNQPLLGGHSVTVVGWLKEYFIIRNSWSIQWGDRGYTYYPFNDFMHHWEIWTALDLSL